MILLEVDRKMEFKDGNVVSVVPTRIVTGKLLLQYLQ